MKKQKATGIICSVLGVCIMFMVFILKAKIASAGFPSPESPVRIYRPVDSSVDAGLMYGYDYNVQQALRVP